MLLFDQSKTQFFKNSLSHLIVVVSVVMRVFTSSQSQTTADERQHNRAQNLFDKSIFVLMCQKHPRRWDMC